jgi:hypothetical protein
MLDAFKKLWADSWGPRLEHILRNALLALLDQPESTLADVLRLLDDRDFRRDVAERTRSAQVRRFWLSEYEGYPARFRAEAIAPVQNKVGAFLANPILHAILTQPVTVRSCHVYARHLPVGWFSCVSSGTKGGADVEEDRCRGGRGPTVLARGRGTGHGQGLAGQWQHAVEVRASPRGGSEAAVTVGVAA